MLFENKIENLFDKDYFLLKDDDHKIFCDENNSWDFHKAKFYDFEYITSNSGILVIQNIYDENFNEVFCQVFKKELNIVT